MAQDGIVFFQIGAHFEHIFQRDVQGKLAGYPFLQHAIEGYTVMSFHDAIPKTRAKARFIQISCAGPLPHQEPSHPPTRTTPHSSTLSAGKKAKSFQRCSWVSRPTNELQKVNKAVIAAVSFTEAHPKRRIRGLSKMPPPMPSSPERKPIIPPTAAAAIKLIRKRLLPSCIATLRPVADARFKLFGLAAI